MGWQPPLACADHTAHSLTRSFVHPFFAFPQALTTMACSWGGGSDVVRVILFDPTSTALLPPLLFSAPSPFESRFPHPSVRRAPTPRWPWHPLSRTPPSAGTEVGSSRFRC